MPARLFTAIARQTGCVIAAFFCLASSQTGVAVASVLVEGSSYKILKTVDGEKFSEVRVRKVWPDRIQIFHAEGAATIPAEMLPETLTKGSAVLSGDALRDLRQEQRMQAKKQMEVEQLRQQQQAAEEPKTTPDEIRARALQRQRDAAVERAERDRENLARPREIKRPSQLASHEEKEAYRARLVMQAIERGEATVADLPEAYGGRPTGSSSRAVAARKAWDRNQAIEMENRLIKAGRITEAAALRTVRLQEESNESLERLNREVQRLQRELWQLRNW